MIIRSGIPFSVIHMNCFMQFFLVEGIRNINMFCMPVHDDVRVSWIDARDLSHALCTGIYLFFIFFIFIYYLFLLLIIINYYYYLLLYYYFLLYFLFNYFSFKFIFFIFFS